MKLATTLSLLVACTGAGGTADPLTDAGTAADVMPGQPTDGGPASNADAAPPPGCTWASVPTGVTIPSLADYAFTISNAGHRAIAYTAMVDGRLDVVVARGNTTFMKTPYGFDLIADMAYTDISAAFTASGVLRVAYNNERVNGYEGGVHYAPTPGQRVFIDGAGLLGRVGGTQIAIGPDGRSHIAYHVGQIGDERIAVASVTGATVSIMPAMIDDKLSDVTIAVDANNTLHVTADDFSDPQRMIYARSTGGPSWSPIVAISPNEQSNGGNLVVGANDILHATRLDKDRIIYGRKPSNGAWQVTTTPFTATSLAPGQTAKAVAVDATGQLHFAWADRYGKLVYERLGHPAVTIQPTGGPVVYNMQLALGPTGPQLAYATASSFASPWSLSVARCD